LIRFVVYLFDLSVVVTVSQA